MLGSSPGYLINPPYQTSRMDFSIVFSGIEHAANDLIIALFAGLVYHQGRDMNGDTGSKKEDPAHIRISRAAAVCLFIALLAANTFGTETNCEGYDNYGGYGCETITDFETTSDQKLETGIKTFTFLFVPYTIGVILRRRALKNAKRV